MTEDAAGGAIAPIVASHLSKRFGTTLAVDDLSFSVEPGSVTGFLGPNGAGKTTTLRMILGLARPTAGSATIAGRPYLQIPRPAHMVGAVLEANNFHPGRSGLNHLRVYCAAAGIPDRRAEELLDLVGLSVAARRPAREYSMGMRQRLGLATALLGDPRVLILDEPGNGLDPEGMAWLRRLLRHLADTERRTVLVSSHVLSEVELTVDRVVIIARGRLVREATLDELHRLGGAATVLVRSPTPEALAAALAPLGVRLAPGAGGCTEVIGATAEAVGRAAWAANVELHELTPGRSNLEQVFLELTGESTGHPPGQAAAAEWTP